MDELTEDVFQPGHHGSTFGGNPVVCAGAIEVLKQISSKKFLLDISSKALYLREQILSLPNVTEVSGLGLMIGISVVEELNVRHIAEKCAEKGLLILTAKRKLRILPPLNISQKEIDIGINILRKCLCA